MKSESERVIRPIRKPPHTVIGGRGTSLEPKWQRMVEGAGW